MSSEPTTQTGLPDTVCNREWSFLLAALRDAVGSEKFEGRHQLLAQEVDWAAMLRLTDRHGAAALLLHSCLKFKDEIPGAVLQDLRGRYETNVRWSLFLVREVNRILDCLSAIGIEAIPYKGPALAEVYYGDMALRQSGDIDLLVRKRDAMRAAEAVETLGFEPRVKISEERRQEYLDYGYEYTFDSEAGINFLELQWALQPRFYSVEFDIDSVFERAVGVNVAGCNMKVPCPEDLFLILAVHAAKHVWDRLIWLCDIAQMMRRENLDWKWIQCRAREIGIERILHVTLRLSNRLLGSEIPAEMRAAMESDRSLQDLTDEISCSVQNGASYDERQVFYFRLMMRLRERRLDRLRFLTRLTFTPGPGEWEAVQLPRIMSPLYRVVRMARLAGKIRQ